MRKPDLAWGSGSERELGDLCLNSLLCSQRETSQGTPREAGGPQRGSWGQEVKGGVWSYGGMGGILSEKSGAEQRQNKGWKCDHGGALAGDTEVSWGHR